MTDSSRGIRHLSIVFSSCITIKGLSKVAAKLPLLEDLGISYTPQNGIYTNYYCCDYLKVIGRSCPVLKSLKLNKHEGILVMEDNRDAFAIARTMHGLQNLQFFGNWLNFKGLHAILEGCPRLESLDLRQCTHLLYLNSKQWGWRARGEGCSNPEDLKARCFEQINKLWRPDDSVEDYEYNTIHKIVDRQYGAYINDMMI